MSGHFLLKYLLNIIKLMPSYPFAKYPTLTGWGILIIKNGQYNVIWPFCHSDYNIILLNYSIVKRVITNIIMIMPDRNTITICLVNNFHRFWWYWNCLICTMANIFTLCNLYIIPILTASLIWYF